MTRNYDKWFYWTVTGDNTKLVKLIIIDERFQNDNSLLCRKANVTDDGKLQNGARMQEFPQWRIATQLLTHMRTSTMLEICENDIKPVSHVCKMMPLIGPRRRRTTPKQMFIMTSMRID